MYLVKVSKNYKTLIEMELVLTISVHFTMAFAAEADLVEGQFRRLWSTLKYLKSLKFRCGIRESTVPMTVRQYFVPLKTFVRKSTSRWRFWRGCWNIRVSLSWQRKLRTQEIHKTSLSHQILYLNYCLWYAACVFFLVFKHASNCYEVDL